MAKRITSRQEETQETSQHTTFFRTKEIARQKNRRKNAERGKKTGQNCRGFLFLAVTSGAAISLFVVHLCTRAILCVVVVHHQAKEHKKMPLGITSSSFVVCLCVGIASLFLAYSLSSKHDGVRVGVGIHTRNPCTNVE